MDAREDSGFTMSIQFAVRAAVAAVVISAHFLDMMPTSSATPSAADAVATIRPLEVRIRRLHRVRPDLMHYPIVYETHC
jgi:hypothetical protein